MRLSKLEAGLARGWSGLIGWRIWDERVARVTAPPIFYLLATIFYTWPYLLDLPMRIPGWPMDNFNFLYKIWWTSHSVFGQPPPGVSLTYNPQVFYPSGLNLAQGELTPINTILTIPITATFGPIVTYNLQVLLSFVLSGWAMYLLVRYLLSGRRLYANTSPLNEQSPPSTHLIPHTSYLIPILCGLAFAFCPYRMMQMGGHLQMLGTQWLPLTFLFAEKSLHTQRWQEGVLAGLFFALCCWEAWYYAAIIGLCLGIYLLIRGWQLRRQHGRKMAKPLLSFILTTVVLVAPFALPYLQLRSSVGLSYPPSIADENSAVPPDYFLPSMLHPLWGDPFMRLHGASNPLENDLYLGVVPLGLFVYVLARRRTATSKFSDFPFSAYLLIAALAFVFSFGLSLHLHVFLNDMGIPATAADDPPMPGWLLYQFVPGFNALRAYARFALPATMAVFVLAGLGLALLLTHTRLAHYPFLTTIVLTLLLLLDFAANPYAYGMSRVESQPQNEWLAAQPDNRTVAYFPTYYALRDGPAMWYSTYHGKPIAYGYESFLPSLYRQEEISATLASFPNDARVWPLLKSWQVGYIMVNEQRYGVDWPLVSRRLSGNPNLRYVAHFQEHSLWDGNAKLWDYWSDFKWHAQPGDIWVYELKP